MQWQLADGAGGIWCACAGKTQSHFSDKAQQPKNPSAESNTVLNKMRSERRAGFGLFCWYVRERALSHCVRARGAFSAAARSSSIRKAPAGQFGRGNPWPLSHARALFLSAAASVYAARDISSLSVDCCRGVQQSLERNRKLYSRLRPNVNTHAQTERKSRLKRHTSASKMCIR